MSKVIWKFPIELKALNEIEMPIGAEILTIQEQFNEPMLWAIVDTKQEKQIRRFVVVGTGNEIPEIILSNRKKYISTFQTDGGNFVFHVFEIM